MSSPSDQNFSDYKRVERKALEILKELKAASPKKADIEVSLLVAIFELHKGTVPPDKIAAIIEGHVRALLPFYAEKKPAE